MYVSTSEIVQKANSIVAQCGTRDPLRIARELGIEIMYYPFNEQRGTAGKQTGYFICELLRLFGTSCAVLLRSLSNEHTIRTEKLIHRNIKCRCQLLRCIQARTGGSAFVSLYGTGGKTPETFASCSCVISFFSLSPFNLSLNFIINSLHKISIFSNTTFWFVKRFRRIFKD